MDMSLDISYLSTGKSCVFGLDDPLVLGTKEAKGIIRAGQVSKFMTVPSVSGLLAPMTCTHTHITKS